MAGQDSDFTVSTHGTFEPWVLEKVCKPALEKLPESVHPNSISIVNTFIVWTMFLLAAVAPMLSPENALMARVLAACGMFATMVLDCLDGMQARRTGRSSKLGEVLDHWLDAAHVPLIGGAIVLTLEVEPWMLAAVAVTNMMIYHAQIVLYHYTRRFEVPPVSGVDGQLGWSAGFIVIGVLFYFFPRTVWWVDWLIAALAVTAIIVQSRICLFYYKMLKGYIVHHLPFVAFNLGFVALYLMGSINTWAFLLIGIFISFRITGGYVINSVLKRSYSGIDIGIVFFLLAIPAVDLLLEPLVFRGYALQQMMPYFACLYLVSRSLIDFIRAYPELKPAHEIHFNGF